MLSTFRSASFVKAMMLIVAAAFVGLIVFEWGADIGGRRGGAVGDTLGSINGEKISIREFEAILKDAYMREKSQGDQEPDNAKLIRQEWDRLVNQILFAQQIVAFGIDVSDKEVNFFNRMQPHPAIQQYEMFQTDGKFDPAKYARFLDDPATYSNPRMKQFVLQVEGLARQALLSQKLQGMVAGAARATGPEVRQAYVDANEKVRVIYAGIEASAFADSLVSVSDDEIQVYYSAHTDEFRQDASVRAEFVSFPKTATPKDEANTQDEIRDILDDIRAGADFAELAKNNSEDPGSAQRGGDLGYFGRGQMVKAFEDTAFSLAPQTVSQPFRTQFGWHILKVEDRKGAGDSLQVHARHILLRVQPGRDTQDSLRMVAEEFVDRATQIGFDATAAEFVLTPSDTRFITADSFFPLLRNRTAGLVRGFLDAESGEVSPTYETEQGIYVFCLKEKREAGPRPLDEVRNSILSRLQQQAKVELARQQMAAMQSELRSGKSLKAAADAQSLRYAEPPAFARNDFVPIVGRENAFVGAAFRLNVGEISDVLTTDRGAYVLRVQERIPIDESAFEKEKTTLAQKLLNQKRNEVFSAWFEDIKEKADIADNRHHFYRYF